MASLICAGAATADIHEPGPLTVVLVMGFNAVDLGNPASPGPVWEIRLEFWDSDWNEPRGDDDLLMSYGDTLDLSSAVPDIPFVHRFVYGRQDDWDDEWGRDELYIRASLFTRSPGFAPSERIVGLIPRRW